MKTRIISAIVMLAIVIPVFLAGGVIYSAFIILLAVAGLREYLNAREEKKDFPILIEGLAYLFTGLFVLTSGMSETLFTVDFRVLSGLLLSLMLPLVLYHDRKVYSINDACYVTAGVLFLGVAMSFFIMYYNLNPNILIYLLSITVFTDTFALLTGMLVGRHKLLEVISPNKTWEGFFGGLFLGSFIAGTFYMTVVDPNVELYVIVFITLFLSVVGQFGDLFFSAIKRYFNKKDFSNLVPGHGGILDRLDSIFFVMLAFSLFITLI